MKEKREERTKDKNLQQSVPTRGKPKNYWELCQVLESENDTDFADFETEIQTIAMSSPSQEQSKLEQKAAVARKAIQRERKDLPHAELMLGEVELPGALRTLARVYDFNSCRLLDQPRESAMNPFRSEHKLQPSMLREVPRELEAMVVDHPHSQQTHEHRLDDNHPLQSYQFQSSSHHASIQAQYHTYAFTQHPSFVYPHHYPPHHMPHFAATYPSSTLSYAMRMVESHRYGHEPPSRFLPAPANSDHAQHSMPNRRLMRLRRHRQPPYVPPPRQLPHRASLYAPPLRQLSHTPIPSGARSSRRPIIVVPEEFSSLVTLHNVLSLLQEQRFVPPAIMRRSELRLLDEVSIVRKYRGEMQHYRVIDNVARLTADEWDQVVAVFVFNPRQQFIGWPNHGDPSVICRQLCAFHLHYKGKPIYRELQSLWLNILSIPEQDRSRDAEILNEFWWKLDQHMAGNDRPMGFPRQS